MSPNGKVGFTASDSGTGVLTRKRRINELRDDESAALVAPGRRRDRAVRGRRGARRRPAGRARARRSAWRSRPASATRWPRTSAGSRLTLAGQDREAELLAARQTETAERVEKERPPRDGAAGVDPRRRGRGRALEEEVVARRDERDQLLPRRGRHLHAARRVPGRHRDRLRARGPPQAHRRVGRAPSSRSWRRTLESSQRDRGGPRAPARAHPAAPRPVRGAARARRALGREAPRPRPLRGRRLRVAARHDPRGPGGRVRRADRDRRDEREGERDRRGEGPARGAGRRGGGERIVEDLDMPLERALELPAVEDREAAAEDAHRLRKRLANIGPVNPVAMEEFESLRERRDFLVGAARRRPGDAHRAGQGRARHRPQDARPVPRDVRADRRSLPAGLRDPVPRRPRAPGA